ncbi:MAG: cytochrome P450 [Acidimicrobiia bacterium]|nr:cytochrome P450 [Acidimicrobiia bacterium]
MAPSDIDLSHINLWDKDRFVEGVPHDWFTELRRDAPVFWHEGDPSFDGPQGGAGPFWCVTGYDDVVTVNRDNATFSSSKKLVFMWDPDEANLEHQQLLMLNMDPPMHTRYRRLINKGFTPRMVSELESTMRKRTIDIIDAVADRGECDFVVDVASELPLQVIADLMGVPQEDRHKLFDWSNQMIGAEDPEYGITEEITQDASMQLYAFANTLAAQKRADPKDDLISVLTHSSVDGEMLSEIELDLFFLLLTVAGNETTRNLISHGMVALLEHPEELEKVRANRALLPGAVEEMLRWASPVMHFRRTATRDVELGGQQIKAGDKVVIWYISANRDEQAFNDPSTFDVERSPNEHVAFGGGGPHFCLGANLARMEIQVMFDEVLNRLDDIEMTAPPARLRSNFINGLKHVPLKFSAK